MGSKMKELKLSTVLSIPFPKFPEEKINEIANLYYNSLDKKALNITNFEKENIIWDKKAGVVDLYVSAQNSKRFLNDVIEKLYNDGTIQLLYKIF
jgi:hypothetical protein